MKARVTPSGSAALWSGALPSSYDGWFVDVVDDPRPEPSAKQVIEPGELAVDYTDGVPVRVRRTWVVRDKTADELRKTWSCLEFRARFTEDERAAVRTFAPDLNETLLSAHEIENDDPLTLFGLSALVAAGILTEARKNQILE